MNRRDAVLAPLVLGGYSLGRTQQTDKAFRIGFLRPGRPPDSFASSFQNGLRELGYVDGKNVVIEYRFDADTVERLAQIANEFVNRKVDVMVVSGAPSALAAQRVAKTTPVVFVGVTSPLELGLVSSLNRPEANITGLSMNAIDLAGKRLELLKEMVPGLKRVTVLSHTGNAGNRIQFEQAEAAARALKVQIDSAPISRPDDFESVFRTEQGRGHEALLLLDNPFFLTHRVQLGKLAASSGIPAIYGFRELVAAGGLMSYGADLPDLYRRAAKYVDKILRGAKPSDLPVEQPVKFEFVINSNTAKALGITIPRSLLLRADEVIQ